MDDPQERDSEDAAGHLPVRTMGDYRLVRSLGRGGFGEVFLGQAPDGTRAAVKVLHPSWAGDADMRRRFSSEVEQARRVSGFCIASILDADPEADEPWIATEFVDGPTLQRAVAEEGPRDGVELHRLAVATATALAAIHAAGVIHRDLKPDNIMLAPDGPRVIDFGIARAAESTSVTASGVIGTIGYMAPEQLEGMRLSSAVDIFSWGSVMVYAATGQEAFPGPTQASRIARVLSGEPDLGQIDAPLREIISGCLNKEAAQRPDAATLLNRLITVPAAGAPARDTTAGHDAAAHTAITPSPDAQTRMGVEGTKVAEDAPEQVPGTRVAPAERVDPTRAYTQMADSDAASAAAPGAQGAAPATGAGSSSGPEPSPVPSSAVPAGRGEASRPGGAPPYHFLGSRFTDAGTLAETMQQNWSSAVQIFSDATERAALGAWLMDDLGDTTLDRSLFRRQVTDANLTLASFIGQLRPDLSPVFRGRGASVTELGELFANPDVILTGAPLANELALLARPEVLRTMGLHDSDRPGAHQQLADHLHEAERAGIAFQEELTGQLAGWRASRPNVSPALVLTFLLHPDRMKPPSTQGGKGAREWIDILWARVQKASVPTNAGYAAAVYGSLATVRLLAQQRQEWETQFSQASEEYNRLKHSVRLQRQLELARRICAFAILGLPMSIFMTQAEVLSSLAAGIGLLGLLGVIVLSICLPIGFGGGMQRIRRAAQLNEHERRLPQLNSGVNQVREDLAKARQISGG